jgi:hypothetical protein
MIEILALLSSLSASLLGTYRSDANCFNTSLITAGMMQEVRIISDKELMSYLKNCQEILKPSQAGDLVVIMDNGDDSKETPIHTFSYINETHGFEKPGITDKEPYRFSFISNIYEYYGVKSENIFPSQKRLTEIFSSPNFEFFTVAYRCR